MINSSSKYRVRVSRDNAGNPRKAREKEEEDRNGTGLPKINNNFSKDP